MKKPTLIIISLIIVFCSVFTVNAFGSNELPIIPINPDNSSSTLPEADTDYEVSGIPITDINTTTAPSSNVSRPKKTRITKLIKGKRRFTVKWKKVKGVKGYQIQYSRSKKFKKKARKTVTIKKAKITKKTIKKLKSGKRYYVRVRTYKVVNGKRVYSKWSAKKSVKVK